MLRGITTRNEPTINEPNVPTSTFVKALNISQYLLSAYTLTYRSSYALYGLVAVAITEKAATDNSTSFEEKAVEEAKNVENLKKEDPAQSVEKFLTGSSVSMYHAPITTLVPLFKKYKTEEAVLKIVQYYLDSSEERFDEIFKLYTLSEWSELVSLLKNKSASLSL